MMAFVESHMQSSYAYTSKVNQYSIWPKQENQ